MPLVTGSHCTAAWQPPEKGHTTDAAITNGLAPVPVEILWRPDEELPLHPNGTLFEALDSLQKTVASVRVYRPGGVAIRFEGEESTKAEVYELNSMQDILRYCTQSGKTFWEYVEECEGTEIWSYLSTVNQAMHASIERGLKAEGILPGGLGLAWRAWPFYRKIHLSGGELRNEGYLPAYALAVAEENAVGGEIVTAPTCRPSIARLQKVAWRLSIVFHP
jgi:L-serine dehydratase